MEPEKIPVPVAAPAPAHMGEPLPEEPEPEPGPVKSLFHGAKWVLAALGSVLLFFVLMALGQLVAYRVVSFASASRVASTAQVSALSGSASVDELVSAAQIEDAADATDSAFAMSVMSFLGEFTALAGIALLWRRMAGRSFISRRAIGKRDPGEVALLVVGAALFGLGVQLGLNAIMSLVFTALPALGEAYREHMTSVTGGADANLLNFLSSAVGAPFAEETLLRGVVLECLLRAFSPTWRRGRELPVPRSGAVVVAVVLQGLIFGVIHMNLVQSTYATVLGALFGYVCWRTGRLRYSILLHLAVNSLSYLPSEALGFLAEVPAASVLFLVAGLALFLRASKRREGDALPV